MLVHLYTQKLTHHFTHKSSPLPSASPLSRGDFSLHRPLAGEIFPSPGEEDVSTADRFVFPRAAGNTRSPSCGDTAPGAAGNTGTCRKCRATACLKPLSAQVQATARARSALYKLVRAANHILPDHPDHPDRPDHPDSKVMSEKSPHFFSNSFCRKQYKKAPL